MTKIVSMASCLLALASLGLLSAPAYAQGERSPEVDFFGDGRFRLEFNDNSGAKDRHRQRMRFRFGTNVTFSDELKVGARAITGNADDPNSPHVDIGDGFNSFEISLDRWFLTYTPDCFEGLTVNIGKFPIRMMRNPVYGEHAWDADVQPEGIQLDYVCCENYGFRFGMFNQLHQSSAEDVWMSYTQGYYTRPMGDDSKVEASLAYLFYGDPNADGTSGVIVGDNQSGNAVSGGQFVSGFGVVDAMLAYHTGAMAFSAELFNNTRAADGQGDTGVAVGGAYSCDVGKFYYQYQTLEQDAIFSPFGQDDFLLSTNMNSHVAGFKMPLTDNMGLHTWVLVSEADDLALGGPADTVYRFRVDLNINF